MNKKLVKIVSAVLAFTMCFAITGCKKKAPPIQIGDDGMAKLNYPDLPTTNGDKNSWEYLDASQKMTVKWYVDSATWPIPTGMDSVSRHIKEKTGITIDFEVPVMDDGTKLATMLAGGTLPDIVSVPSSQTVTLSTLAKQGYVYDLNTLADKWAPTLKTNLPQDVWKWWAYGNGKTYGIPNHYYSYEDVPEGQLQPNGGLMVRKDIFEAWQAVAQSRSDGEGMVTYTAGYGENKGVEKKVEWQGYITTPEGFKEAAIWAKENYGGTKEGELTNGLLLSQFKQDGNTSVEWISQFFAIPFEDSNGNFQYKFTQKAYEDMLVYLNDLYIAGVISNGNFSQTYDNIGGVIAGGQAFATAVTPQDYQMHFQTAKNHNYEYVSLYITNENGDSPILADIRGYGYMMNMITTNCKRPDVVIKLFDYLTSDEGQLLVSLGVEGETWNYTDATKTATMFTQKYLDDKNDGREAQYGLLSFDLLINWQLYDNMQPRTNHGKTVNEVYRTNLKRPLSIYAYDCNATSFLVDATDKRYSDYDTALTKINSLIGKQLPKIIGAKTEANARSAYKTTVDTMAKYNLELVMQMNNEAYKKAKQKLGITVGWPAYRSDFVSHLDRTQPNGDLSLYRSY